jgi:putative inorganic carbon (HCO3(-)) transporter
MFASREPKKLPMTPLVVVLMLFMTWMTLTGFTAFEQEPPGTNGTASSRPCSDVPGHDRHHPQGRRTSSVSRWVVALSLGFYGFKGGLFTIMTGGHSRVLGPYGTYIADNNDLALALVMTVPLVWYLQAQATNKWLRYALIALAVLTMAAAAGSYSRGALLAGGAMLVFLWLKSANKARTGIVLLLALPLLFMFMPEAVVRADGQHRRIPAGRLGDGTHQFLAHGLQYRLAQPDGRRLPLLHAGGVPGLRAGAAERARPAQYLLPGAGRTRLRRPGAVPDLPVPGWRTGSRVLRFAREKPELKWASETWPRCARSASSATWWAARS